MGTMDKGTTAHVTMGYRNPNVQSCGAATSEEYDAARACNSGNGMLFDVLAIGINLLTLGLQEVVLTTVF